jgi:hypothetical protein
MASAAAPPRLGGSVHPQGDVRVGVEYSRGARVVPAVVGVHHGSGPSWGSCCAPGRLSSLGQAAPRSMWRAERPGHGLHGRGPALSGHLARRPTRSGFVCSISR